MPNPLVEHDPLAMSVTKLERPQRGHIVELDSLRGVAALFVVFDHFMRGWVDSSPPHFVRYIPYLPFLSNGGAAVMMFFVLSGFVLSLPMMAGKSQSYPIYAARRVCRIYLPYLAALLIALVFCWRFHGLDSYAPVFSNFWKTAPTLHLVVQHLLFLGRYDVYAYNAPTWSLVHEMRISLIFPLLCLVAARLRPWTALLVALSFPVAGRLVEKYTAPWYETGTSSIFWSETLGFCGIFLIGSLLARYREPLVDWVRSVPGIVRWILPVVAIALYQYPALLHIPRPLRNFAIGLGAAYFLILALVPDGWLSRMLRLAPLRFLGRVSYSLYLTHAPILIVMSLAIWGKMPYLYLLLPFLAVAFAFAALFYRIVEQPSIELGKVISRRWRRPAVEKLNAVVA